MRIAAPIENRRYQHGFWRRWNPCDKRARFATELLRIMDMSALRASAYRPHIEEDVVSRVSGTALNLGMRKQNAYEAFAEWIQQSAAVPSGHSARNCLKSLISLASISAICHSTYKESP